MGGGRDKQQQSVYLSALAAHLDFQSKCVKWARKLNSRFGEFERSPSFKLGACSPNLTSPIKNSHDRMRDLLSAQ